MIRVGRLPPSRMRSRKIASLRRVAVASPSYVAQRGRPETPTDLARHACIIRTSAQDARAWTFYAPDGTSHRVPIESVFEADNAHVTMHAACAGMGIAVVPFYHVREAVEAGRAEVVLDDFALAPILAHAVWPSGSRTTSRVRAPSWNVPIRIRGYAYRQLSSPRLSRPERCSRARKIVPRCRPIPSNGIWRTLCL
jgi:DNA-binding transcriptional LysR family regulator